ncbi:DUF2189 domain-containing protein [Palleronia caenipelagi]|uniref:DUF2189 domain-containing protein n=1 Tax=Palleronia caenipelagi TaxID=2489174 RepID=A0A547Q5Y7_9RHOB|nr:DUF2189 domain-containing protein [Palleronia caenipelagi]TRD21795.1 DUF2189 domain-containing protein [Palleronia caenipelagi]
MTDQDVPQRTALRPSFRKIEISDLKAALADGWQDFRSAPFYGLVFGGLTVLGGWLLLAVGAGLFIWTLTMVLGFPLVAPFIALGCYEVSRRLDDGLPLDRKEIFGVIWSERRGQLPWAALVIGMFFLFWSFLAHMIFALVLGPSVLMGSAENLATYTTGVGLRLLIVEMILGAILAFVLFTLMVITLPLLVDRDVDVVTAMIASVSFVKDNFVVMMIWALTISVINLLASLPLLLGLVVALPVLGHASWHLYRRAIL